jgi:nicotinamidase-related amidase
VVQTVSELAEAGYRPFVISDAICAADSGYTEAARARMRAADLPLLSAESALCEWLRDAAHPLFQQLLAERT